MSTLSPSRVFAMALLCALGACDEPEPPEQEVPVQPRTDPKASKKAADEPAQKDGQEAPERAPGKGLVLAYSQFEGTKPGDARAELLIPQTQGEWKAIPLEDPDSNVFHKVLVHAPEGADPALITLGGSKAMVKRWEKTSTGFKPETLWEASFGGKFDRMRDAELGDVYGDGSMTLAVGTHDQGVVAMLRPQKDDWKVEEIDRTADTFIHEIELGDLNADGVLEVYATPSEPNRLDAGEQSGRVVRYVPKKGKKAKQIVADLGKRHAKEILVDDVDGDGTDELYVAVEALTKGDKKNVEIVEPVEIRRYDADTKPTEGVVVARIPDRFCRFLTAGDLEGDGKKEMVAAAFRSGVWLLRPGKDPKKEWQVENVDDQSSGFEHAALLTDLDEDGKDELYVAADEQGELRRYVWKGGKLVRETIHSREDPRSMWTWNIMPAPPSLFP